MRTPLFLAAAWVAGCGDPSCLKGGDDCVVATPCPELAWTCADGYTAARRIEEVADIPGGLSAGGAKGDYILENDRVLAVIEDLDHPHNQAITGGSIIDMATASGDNDSLRHFWQATGLLPRDYVEYTDIEVLEDGPIKAVQVHGRLQGRPDTRIHTRYEIRPCEPGVRIRTEVINLEREPTSWDLLDGLYFGGRENLAFAPFPGGGFNFRSFGLGELTEVMTPVPYVVAGMHAEPAATYAVVACNQPEAYTFLTEEVTPVGLAPALVMPRDYLVYERFLAAADGAAISAGADLALEIRDKLFDEPWTTVRGRVAVPDGTDPGAGLRALVTVSEGTAKTPREERVPWTLAIPDADGMFEARVPTGRSYVAEVEAFGRVVAEAEAKVGSRPADFGEIPIPAVGELTLTVTVDGADDGDDLLVFVHPSDEATRRATEGRMLGHFDTCAPLLGHPHAGSPACNRILAREGEPVTLPMVPGSYDFAAVAGPFSTLALVRGVAVEPGTGQSVHLDVQRIDGLKPAGTLSGDFHVHGRSSFDSSFNDVERVRTFRAADLDVIASTEHDVAFDFSQVLADLGATDEMEILVGTEMTGAVLWYWNPTVSFPQVVGHWNVWPLAYDPVGPWRGAPWDEMAEPGELLDRAVAYGWDEAGGVAQLNHPIGGVQFGRDFGWISATGMRADAPLSDDPHDAQGLWGRTPRGASHANSDYDVQEVMNGTANASFEAYRAFWFYLLDHGELRGGTANSDTHTLTENIVGMPQTLVWTDQRVGPDFDQAAFNAAVREGRMIGTNGPVIEASLVDAAGVAHGPSLDLLAPAPGAELAVRVSAAPWVGVDEIRFWVNGELVHVIDGLPPLGDPAGVPATADALVRFDGSVPLADLLPAGEDGWIVIEAGAPLPPSGDLDCDGWPDTSDHNGDGAVDWKDVDGAEGRPEGGCFAPGDAGPMSGVPEPDRSDPGWAFWAVVPGGYPLAFTNPFVVDGDGDGVFTGVGR